MKNMEEVLNEANFIIITQYYFAAVAGIRGIGKSINWRFLFMIIII